MPAPRTFMGLCFSEEFQASLPPVDQHSLPALRVNEDSLDTQCLFYVLGFWVPRKVPLTPKDTYFIPRATARPRGIHTNTHLFSYMHICTAFSGMVFG